MWPGIKGAEVEAEEKARNRDMGTKEWGWWGEQKAWHQIENELWQIMLWNPPLPVKSPR